MVNFDTRFRTNGSKPGHKIDKPFQAIELAVFVDDELFQREKSQTTGRTEDEAIDSIQNMVFTYLNSVSVATTWVFRPRV